MRVGQRVMLIGSDDFMPPMGAVGFVVGPLDWMGDHEVDFPQHPCPVAEPTWEIPAKWLMPLDDDDSLEESASVRNREKLSTG